MFLPKKECVHIVEILRQTKEALLARNSIMLKSLSNNTIHNACNYQDSSSISIAVIIYTLSKLVERGDFNRFRNWDNFVKKINSLLDLAARTLGEGDHQNYEMYVEKVRKTIESHSISLKPYVHDVLKKASINKGSKLYEHGISLEQTSKLLGVSQWELADYIGSKANSDYVQHRTMDVRKRAKMALEFFS
ncbi:MAG: hypothetical protein KC506_03305 [Nanoarchaeota archaeon]|nr:hypothetical protein [Nanoarchaeota archaeon]